MMDLSKSHFHTTSRTSFFDSDSEEDDDFVSFSREKFPDGFGIRPGSSTRSSIQPPFGTWNLSFKDHGNSEKVHRNGRYDQTSLIAKINKIINDNEKSILHAVEAASANVTQLESRIHNTLKTTQLSLLPKLLKFLLKIKMAFSYAKLACLLIIAMAVAAPAAEAAFSCGAVTKNLVPCLGYLKGGAGPSPPCCGGVKTLVSMARTPADRQTACGCLKQTSGAIKGINMGNAASLPSKCGASVPYPISPNVDCSKVH